MSAWSRPRRGEPASAMICRVLRAEILSLARKPGEPISERQIAKHFGVSRTPVHEAVLRLADDGLIAIFPQSGTFVAPIPVDALPEASAIRRSLEQETVAAAAGCASRSQIARLRANLALQHEVDAAGDVEGFHQADDAFHLLIAEIAGYPGFWPYVQQAKVQIDRCQRLSLPLPGRMSAVIAEHEAIANGIAAHDPDRAVRALCAHVNGLLKAVSGLRLTHPACFDGVIRAPVTPV